MIRATFTREKETASTYRYKEDATLPVIGTIYIKKPELEKMGNPDHIVVIVEAVTP